MTSPASNVCLRAGRCQCPACGELFTSVREFDRHRVGSFAQMGGRHDRRCLTAEDLKGRGWRKDARGFWMQGRRRQYAPAKAGELREGTTESLTGREVAGHQNRAGARGAHGT